MSQAAQRRSVSENAELAGGGVVRCALAHFCLLLAFCFLVSLLFVSSRCSSALDCPRSNNLQQYAIVPSVAQKQTSRAERP